MRIAAAAALTGLSPRQIRSYQDRGIAAHGERTRGRHRTFTDRDLHRLAMLKTLLTADVPPTLAARAVSGQLTPDELRRVEVLMDRHLAAGQHTRAELRTGVVDEPDGQPDISLMFDIFVLRTRMGVALTTALAPAVVTATEYALLSVLHEAGPSTTAELARLLGAAPTTLGRQLAELVRRGWARRDPETSDRRRPAYALTAAGQERFAAALPLAARFAADLDRGLRERGTEPETARRLLQSLSATLTTTPQRTR